MKEKTACIIGAGNFKKEDLDFVLHTKKEEPIFFIAADGGYSYAKEAGISFHMVIGDFDSLKKIPKGENVKKYPVKKDDTDMLLAVKEALSLGIEEFYLLGGIGGRIDHTIANIQTLLYLSRRGKKAYLLGEGKQMTVLTNDSMTFDKSHRGIFSVFCMGAVAEGVTIRGFQYEVSEATLTNEIPLGVSNAFLKEEGMVSVQNGSLLLIWETENSVDKESR